jgi:hypothetical protein
MKLINRSQIKRGQRVRIIIDTTVEDMSTYNPDEYEGDMRERVDVLFAGRHTLELPDLTNAIGTSIAVLVH